MPDQQANMMSLLQSIADSLSKLTAQMDKLIAIEDAKKK